MKKCSWLTLSRVLVAVMVIAIWSACTDNNVIAPEDEASAAPTPFGTTERKISPKEYAGNFASSGDDNQVCYDMSALGYIGEVTGDMRGIKIDPPAPYSDNYLSTTLSADGRYLNWTTTAGTQVLAFIIKGGPNYHVYDYVSGTGVPSFNWASAEYDNGLVSPRTQSGKKWSIPQISHYNACYIPPVTDGEGCTPGYWRNHIDRWVGASPSDNFDATFGVTLFGAATLCQVISAPQTYGAYAMHAVAALLNANGGVPNSDGEIVDEYAYTADEVIAGFANGTLSLGDFTDANEAGCPLSGTKAVKCN